MIDGTCEDAESFTPEEYVKFIEEKLSEENDEEDLNETWENVDKDDIYEVIDFANRFLERNAEIFEINKTTQISDRTGCFFNKRASKDLCNDILEKSGV